MDQSKTGTFIKFGQEEHMRKLLNTGEIYMQKLCGHVRTGDVVRGDTAEGAMLYFSGEGLAQVTIDGEPVPKGTSFLSVHGPWSECGSYCMSLLRETKDINEKSPCFRRQANHIEVSLDPRMQEFGDWFVLVLDPAAFQRRLFNAMKRLGFSPVHGNVRYHPEFSNMVVDQFLKRDGYDYQGEWRVMTEEPLSSSSVTFHIGSIEDVAVIGTLVGWPKDCPINIHFVGDASQSLDSTL